MNAVRLYRLAHWLHVRRVPLLPKLVERLLFVMYNSVVPCECEIGPGSKFVHGGIGVVLHPKAVIGARVFIGQGITVGGTMGSGVPAVGDDVLIGPGARILGGIRVGSNVVIGANSVVVRDVPDNVVVAGIPARVIRQIPPGALDTERGAIADASEG